jgi:hypothetical protein
MNSVITYNEISDLLNRNLKSDHHFLRLIEKL